MRLVRGDKLFSLKSNSKIVGMENYLNDDNNDLLGKEISGSFEIYSNFKFVKRYVYMKLFKICKISFFIKFFFFFSLSFMEKMNF